MAAHLASIVAAMVVVVAVIVEIIVPFVEVASTEVAAAAMAAGTPASMVEASTSHFVAVATVVLISATAALTVETLVHPAPLEVASTASSPSKLV